MKISIEQIDRIYDRIKTPHTSRAQGDTLIDARCVVHDGFVTFVGISGPYHCTIYAGAFTGAKCDCPGYHFKKKCKHLMALAMWIKGER